MDFQQLKYFISAGKTLSFVDTAYEFDVSRQAVGIAIRKLENELGVQLFVRSGNRVTLSKKGEEIYENARCTVELFNNLESMSFGSRVRTLKFGLDSMLVDTTTSLMGLFDEYCKTENGCEIITTEDFYDTAVQDLLEAKRDVCLLRSMEGSPAKCERVVIRKRYLALVMDMHHPMSSRSHIDVSELQGLTFIERNMEKKRYRSVYYDRAWPELAGRVIGRINSRNLIRDLLAKRDVVILGSANEDGVVDHVDNCVAIPITGVKNNVIEDVFLYRTDSVNHKQIEDFLRFMLKDDKWKEAGFGLL